MSSHRKIRLLGAAATAIALALVIGGNAGNAGAAGLRASPFVRTAFTWTDQHTGSHDWDDACNWGDSPNCSSENIPSSSGDTATFPAVNDPPGGWLVQQRQYTIGVVTCKTSVDFTGGATLTANKLVIDAVASTNDLDVTISGLNGDIIANP